jgi:hypothetical protein
VDPAGLLLVNLEDLPDEAVLPVNGKGASVLELEAVLKDPLPWLDAGHFAWEDASEEYAALVTSWWSGGCATTTT